MASDSEDADGCESANSINITKNYKCCKGKPYGSITCVQCGAVYHQSCAARSIGTKFSQIDESRLICCKQGRNNGEDKTAATNSGDATTDVHKFRLLEQENLFIREICAQIEKKNTILKENNSLLVEENKQLLKIIQELSTKNSSTLLSKSDREIAVRNASQPHKQTDQDIVISNPEHRNSAQNLTSQPQIIIPTEHTNESLTCPNDISHSTGQKTYAKAVRSRPVNAHLRVEPKFNHNNHDNHNIKNVVVETASKKNVSGNAVVNSCNPQTDENQSQNDNSNTSRNQYIYRKRKKNVRVGTAENNESQSDNLEFQARNYKRPEDKKLWLFISKAKSTVTENIVKNYCARKGKIREDDVEVKSLQIKGNNGDNNCFLVGVPLNLKDTIYENDFWPNGIRYERFDFRLGKRFLDRGQDV